LLDRLQAHQTETYMQMLRVLRTIVWNCIVPPAVLLVVAGLFWLLFSFPLVLFGLALVLLWGTPKVLTKGPHPASERVQLLPPEGDYLFELFEHHYGDTSRHAGDRTLPLLDGRGSARASVATDSPPETFARSGEPDLPTLDRQLLDAKPVEFWRDHLFAPLASTADSITVAVANPEEVGVGEHLRDALQQPVRIVRATPRKILAALEQAYQHEFIEESRSGLLRRRPDDSAFRTITGAQRVWGVAVLAIAVAGLFVWKLAVLILLNLIAQFFYLGLTFYKLGLVLHLGATDRDVEIPLDHEPALSQLDLPLYSVLVPVYREARVLPTLVRALSEIDYPHDKLQVNILLEADDVETIAAANQLDLPEFISVVVVPPSEPRTKPKACNYGLQTARGEYLVVYDAEDIPESDQLLKAVAAFRQAGPELACVQAKLVYFNRNQNLLTRWFAAEYLMWFDIMLPSLHAAELSWRTAPQERLPDRCRRLIHLRGSDVADR
jgi:Glycosyltransferase like family 2/Type II secretion system (T2SS), protein E, N-terminal domain